MRLFNGIEMSNGNEENKRIIWFKLAISSLLFSSCQVTSGGNQKKTEEIVQFNQPTDTEKEKLI